ncbi:MAG TPA: hypothetical protein VFG04_13245 [Planctomycetaceae bacterium]|jgi:hypothetical protein|nr:hypothetical protein [Planctomycetaceae bacterium]
MHHTAHNIDFAIQGQSRHRETVCLRLGLCAVALGICGCNSLSTPAPASPPSVASCHVEQDREYKFGERTQLHIWNLKVANLKELKAQLLVISAGKVQVVDKVECQWSGWDEAHPSADGQLILLVEGPQTGPAQRVPHLGLDFKGLSPHTKSETHTGLTIDGSLRTQMHTTSSGDLANHLLILSAELFVPATEPAHSFSLGPTVESLVEASKAGRGRVVLAVTLEPKS